MSPSTKILVLGHRGMLGNAVFKYFSRHSDFAVFTTSSRYGDDEFAPEIKRITPDYIINCIGIIPQKHPEPDDYERINVNLPLFIDTLGIKTIHPSTDCEFKGDIPPGEKYSKTRERDADDIYGMSKVKSSAILEKESNNTKIIRTSIIGHELHSNLSLLDWFLSQENETRGYTNHYWNGITTLEWAKRCEQLIKNWHTMPTLNQYGITDHLSKYDVLTTVKEVYKKEITLVPFAPAVAVNKCLESDIQIASLKQLLTELRAFYNK